MDSNRWLGTALSSVFLASLWAVKDTSPGADQQRRLKVIIVGEATNDVCLPEERIKLVKEHPEKADGCAIAAGANAALASLRYPDARGHFKLQFVDDRGKENVAEAVARKIESDPDVIAVIGHTASGTTRHAIPFYSEAGIPLLMPVATNPSVNHPYDRSLQAKYGSGPALGPVLPIWVDKHWNPDYDLPNAFRLIPNDARAQVPALAYAAINLSSGKTVLVADLTDDSPYGDYLANELEPKLRSRLKDVEVIRIKDHLNDGRLTYEICDHLLLANLVVFCGTKERATAMLTSLKERRLQRKMLDEWPRFLLSDSSRPISGFPSDVNLHVTFPVPKFPDQGTADADQKLVLGAAVSNVGQSYEVFAYDAVLLISRVISKIRDEKLAVNRANVLSELSQIVDFQGAILNYTFVKGENIHPDYHIYSAGPSVHRGQGCGKPPQSSNAQAGMPASVLTYDCVIAPDDLAAIRRE